MANAVCHDGYCESISNRDDSSAMTFVDKAIIGGAGLLAIAVLALSLYGVSLGYYPVPL